MSTSPFRQTVADVAARAKERLPASINGRLEGAVKLVLGQDVTPQADGTILVGSCTDPLKQYRLVGTACECKDFTDGKAPDGWCRHRIAAGIHKRCQQELAAQSTRVLSEGAAAPLAPVDHAPAVPLPEAPVSITLKATLHGHDVLVTLRGVDFASVKAQVEEASEWLQAQTPTALPQGQGKDWCQVHGVSMKPTTKEGRTWHSHRTEQGQWCKGKGVRA